MPREEAPTGTAGPTDRGGTLKNGFPSHPRRISLFRIGVVCLVLLVAVAAFADPDLPGPGASPELIPAGSLVIPMDNDKQNIGAVFNLKAYGAVVRLLWDEVPVRWAIRAGKAKDGFDFSATAQRILPTAQGASSYSFGGGPFIVHRDWAAYARSKLAGYGGNVAVYELTQDVTVDIRYKLSNKPKVAVLDDGGNADIHSAILAAAGLIPGTHYNTVLATTLSTVNANSATAARIRIVGPNSKRPIASSRTSRPRTSTAMPSRASNAPRIVGK